MQDITVGGTGFQINGTPFTPFIYEDAFKQSMLGDFERFASAEKGESRYYDVMPRMAWAMIRSAVYPEPFMDYAKWRMRYAWDDLDVEVAKAVMLEAARALFPGRPGLVAQLEGAFNDAAGGDGKPVGAGDGD